MSRFAVEMNKVMLNYKIHHERSQSLKAAVIGRIRRRDRAEIFPALKGIDLTVSAGESLAVVGPNGSGKSTLLKLIAGVFAPSSGTIRVQGRVAALLELGAGLHPELTGAENVYLFGALLGMARRETARRFKEIVDFSELGHFIDAPVRHYSSGMFMRLAFSIAIHGDPDVLLFDEVIAVGDASFQAKCYERIAAIRRSGKTMIVVSHAPEMLRPICDRGLLLKFGSVAAVGPLGEVLDHYAKMTRPK